jgi:hypothetical protein
MNQMGQKIVAMIALGTFALVIGLGELFPPSHVLRSPERR